MYKCPCCGKYGLEYPNANSICQFCGWEDEPADAVFPDEESGPNGVSMNEFRRIHKIKYEEMKK
jgi:hypothetical protein